MKFQEFRNPTFIAFAYRGMTEGGCVTDSRVLMISRLSLSDRTPTHSCVSQDRERDRQTTLAGWLAGWIDGWMDEHIQTHTESETTD